MLVTCNIEKSLVRGVTSVTRFGDFKKCLATINLLKSPTFLGNFCKGVKIYHVLVKSFLGNFYRHLAMFSGHTGSNCNFILLWRCFEHIYFLITTPPTLPSGCYEPSLQAAGGFHYTDFQLSLEVFKSWGQKSGQ